MSHVHFGTTIKHDLVEKEEQNMRKMIIEIQKNPKYTAKEKQNLIFSLFNKKGTNSGSCGHSHNETSGISVLIGDLGDPTRSRAAVKSLLTTVPVTNSEDKYVISSGGAWIQIPCAQLHPTPQSGKCEHYTRGCSIYTECCRQFFSCRLCHDRATDHTLDPKNVKVIRCHDCSQIQLASNLCTNHTCKKVFGEYYCGICKLWSTGVNIYHCDKCKICLRGKEDIENRHCDVCNYCMPVSRYNDHICCKLGGEICPICSEDFEGCLGDHEKTRCGHIFHMSCMEKYISHDVCCPVCRKTLFDMSMAWEDIDILKLTEEIPEDYKLWQIEYICNDCSSNSTDKFSIYGNKCHCCGGYNTAQTKILRPE